MEISVFQGRDSLSHSLSLSFSEFGVVTLTCTSFVTSLQLVESVCQIYYMFKVY